MTDEQPESTGEQPESAGEQPQATESAPESAEVPEPASEASPADAGVQGGGAGMALRIFAAVITLPWLVLYGITGAWAVTRAARAAAGGLEQLDAGYTRLVTPGGLGFVGVLLLAAFAVVLAAVLLLLFRRSSAGAWLAVLVAAAALTAGAVWAAVQGGLHPLLWVLLFFGLAYVLVVALVCVVKVTWTRRRGTIGSP